MGNFDTGEGILVKSYKNEENKSSNNFFRVKKEKKFQSRREGFQKHRKRIQPLVSDIVATKASLTDYLSPSP
jgi:hypothetical protein